MRRAAAIASLSLLALAALPQDPDRRGVPTWPVDPEFMEDTFRFVRVRYSSTGRGWDKWATDYPDSDLNFSFRLQQVTSLKVNPDPIVLDLTDPRLFGYPWLYLIEPGDLRFSEEEVVALRRYLLNGGFLMVDDFWGDYEFENFHDEIKRVFPDRDVVDLELDHPIFHCVFDLKEKPQVPSIHAWLSGYEWERGSGGRGANYRAIYDDKKRMMVVICHNTDLGDGWEREGENEGYFKEHSEPRSYPMGINIVFYAMTH